MPRRAKPFWSRVERGPRCWLWMGARNPEDYGVSTHATRCAFTHGTIPFGLHVCHHCDNPPCVNPSHLFLGTNQDNVRDRHQKGRTKNLEKARRMRGEDRYWTNKLSAQDVRAIRRQRGAGATVTQLAREFDVHASTISRIARHIYRQEVA